MAEVEELCGRIAFLSKGELLRIDTAEHIKRLIPQQIVRVRFQAGTDLNGLLQYPGNNGLPQPQQSGTDTVQFTLDKPQQQLDSLLRHLTQASGPIADLHIERPSLEDVFIKVARGEI
jgi:ABC-type multidrug transport system ATPase subunit